MEDLERTMEIIPITTLERILSDDNTFSNFINGYNEFLAINKSEYICALNNYMNIIIRKDTSLSKEVFDRINYINSLYNVDHVFDFSSYLDSTTPIINLGEIESILTNDNVFKKFLDFDNNKDIFHEDLSVYLSAINDYIVSISKINSLGLSSDVKEKYREIMKQYSLEYKVSNNIEGYEVTSKVDQSIIDKIIGTKYKSIEGMSTFDIFAMCRDIYVELCHLCNYDIGFAAHDNDKNDPYSISVYNNDISNVTVKNTSVICKSFSEIYAALLNYVGVKAKVAGNFHKYVIFDCDGTLMKADGTNVFLNEAIKTNMNDLSAVKMGFQTAGFTCLEVEKDISKQIQMADLKNKFYKTTLEMKFRKDVDSYRTLSHSQIPEELMGIEEKLNMINQIGLNNSSNLDDLALAQYYSIVLNNVFNVSEKEIIDNKYIAVKGMNDSYSSGVLLSINYDGQYKFYTLFKSGVSEIDRDILMNLIESGNITVMSHSCINGLYNQEVTNGIAM